MIMKKGCYILGNRPNILGTTERLKFFHTRIAEIPFSTRKRSRLLFVCSCLILICFVKKKWSNDAKELQRRGLVWGVETMNEENDLRSSMFRIRTVIGPRKWVMGALLSGLPSGFVQGNFHGMVPFQLNHYSYRIGIFRFRTLFSSLS